MTLELVSNFSSGNIATLKNRDKSFKSRWIQDEVIGSYLFSLVKQHDQIIYCGSSKALALSHCRSINLLWDGDALANFRRTFELCNPSGRHWILILLGVKVN